MSAVLQRATSLRDHLVDLRRAIHRHPEPGFREFETSQLVERELTAIGSGDNRWTIRRVAGTGIIADIGPFGDGILLRADMDALEIEEETGVEYASRVKGMMHACGHDAHTAILLGAARVIAEQADQLKRGVRLVFQPSEETHPGGALSMIAGGALEGIAGAVALHVYPQEPVGTIALKSGPMMANSDDFNVVFRGVSGHAAQPHNTRDSLVAAADFVAQIQKIVSRRVDPFENVVVTVGKLAAGTRRNVIASEAVIEGTIRTLNSEMRMKGRELLERAARAAAEIVECGFDLTWIEGYPVVMNDKGMTRYVERIASDIVGEDGIRIMTNPSMGGEDFAYIAQKVPSCFFRLGSSNDDPATKYGHHNAQFNIDESCLSIGVALMSSAALSWRPEASPREAPVGRAMTS